MPLPSLPPARPPRKPTDNQPTDRLAGRVTRGGTGPCYGVTTDDGREYALHGPAVGPLRTGGYVRLRIAAMPTDGSGPPTADGGSPGVDCGSGIPARIVSVEPVE